MDDEGNGNERFSEEVGRLTWLGEPRKLRLYSIRKPRKVCSKSLLLSG